MLFFNAKIHTGENKVIAHGYLKIEDGKIADFGEQKDCSYSLEDGISLEGMTIYPGFIDSHSHIGMWEDGLAFEGDDGNEDTDPTTPQMRAIDGINPRDAAFVDAYRAGVTTVVTGPGSTNPIGGGFVAMKTHGVRMDDMMLRFPVGIKFALGENPKQTYRDKEQQPITRMGIAATIRNQLQKGQNYARDLRRYQQNEEEQEPEFDQKCEALLPLFDRKAKAFFHCHRADDIFTALRIAKEFSLDAVLIHATEGHLVASELALDQGKVIVGPVLCDRCKPELREHTIETANSLQQYQIPIAICTDHPVVPQQYLPLSAGLAVRGGLSKQDALHAITLGAAQLVGIEDRVGSISVGKDADLAIFREMDDIFSSYTTPQMVVINGRIAYERDTH